MLLVCHICRIVAILFHIYALANAWGFLSKERLGEVEGKLSRAVGGDTPFHYFIKVTKIFVTLAE